VGKTPDIEMKVKPYVRIGDEWVPLTDLTPEQTAVLQAAYAKAVPPDFEDMVARAWDLGFNAAGRWLLHGEPSVDTRRDQGRPHGRAA
jgi:hypothetical protein